MKSWSSRLSPFGRLWCLLYDTAKATPGISSAILRGVPIHLGYLNGHCHSQAEYSRRARNYPYFDNFLYTLQLHDPFWLLR